MNKHQWVHEEGQTDGQDQNEDCGKGRKLETATFEAVEFLTIDRSHHPPASSNLPASAGPLEVAAIPIGSGLPYNESIDRRYFVTDEATGKGHLE